MTLSLPLRQRFTACLAILAVLLLFVAPMVSKTLMAQQSQASAQPDLVAAAMPQHTGMRHDAMASMPDDGHHAMMMDGSMPGMAHTTRSDSGMVCGYCDLLIHVPLMVWIFIPFIWLTLIISRAPPIADITPPPVPRDTRTHPPRAPPAFVCYALE